MAPRMLSMTVAMTFLFLLFSLAAPEAVSALAGDGHAPAAAVAADTSRPRPAARPAQQGGGRAEPQPVRGKPSREPEARRSPQAERGKPSSQPTGDPQLKRRKPPSLHSSRRP